MPEEPKRFWEEFKFPSHSHEEIIKLAEYVLQRIRSSIRSNYGSKQRGHLPPVEVL